MSDSAVRAVRARRDESNSAIVARDLDRVVSCMMEDVRVAVAGGPVLIGREASRKAFAEQFADVTFKGYIRDADVITVREDDMHATERGRWTGRWRHRAGEHFMRGTYVAEWTLTALGWFIQSEEFTSTN